MYKARIAGTGSYLPEKLLTNAELEKLVETDDAWIQERTGIKHRHIASSDQCTSDLALIAARQALDMAGLKPTDLELILFATVTPDQIMPNAACCLQQKLGCRPIPAFDISAACSGFVYGTTVAHQFIKTGFFKNILVVGAEVLSRIMNYKDRETCILFGDGAGCVVLSRASEESQSEILSEHFQAEGNLGHLFELLAGGSKLPLSQKVLDEGLQFARMKGREIFKNAVRTLTHCCEVALQANNMTVKDVDWLIPHQANIRILEAVARSLEIPTQRVIINVQDTGNTSAATIPIALDQAVRDGRIQRGHVVLMAAFGAGLTSGSLLVKF